ncbi:MAG: PhoH family protein [candidate division Zixibacteria bacterium]|nr:PhoH family protein [candidate division Zixibacteria bacterium]
MSVTSTHITRTIDLRDVDQRVLFGQNNLQLRLIESQFDVKIVARGDTVVIEGEKLEVENVVRLLEDVITRLRQGHEVTEQYLFYAIGMVKEEGRGPAELLGDRANGGAPLVTPRTVGQKEYLEAIEKHDIVFAIGPAGTGKTYLAVGHAVAELKAKLRNRIILVRPAVEAGESLGFLPGDIKAKVDPYLRPVYDALHVLVPAEKIAKMIELGIIEICPLAFMRGRTLNNSFVILDEAQNTTIAQMKMFLTRLGEGSKAVITGDITQIDLDEKVPSGLVKIQHILTGIKGISFVYLSSRDVVRHRLVQDIINAYERYENSPRPKGSGKGH